MATRNITLTLPDELVRRAKVIAAQRDTSVSALVADFLRQLDDQGDYDQVWQREAQLMRAGLPMRTGEITWTREHTHER